MSAKYFVLFPSLRRAVEKQKYRLVSAGTATADASIPIRTRPNRIPPGHAPGLAQTARNTSWLCRESFARKLTFPLVSKFIPRGKSQRVSTALV